MILSVLLSFNNWITGLDKCFQLGSVLDLWLYHLVFNIVHNQITFPYWLTSWGDWEGRWSLTPPLCHADLCLCLYRHIIRLYSNLLHEVTGREDDLWLLLCAMLIFVFVFTVTLSGYIYILTYFMRWLGEKMISDSSSVSCWSLSLPSHYQVIF